MKELLFFRIMYFLNNVLFSLEIVYKLQYAGLVTIDLKVDKKFTRSFGRIFNFSKLGKIKKLKNFPDDMF